MDTAPRVPLVAQRRGVPIGGNPLPSSMDRKGGSMDEMQVVTAVEARLKKFRHDPVIVRIDNTENGAVYRMRCDTCHAPAWLRVYDAKRLLSRGWSLSGAMTTRRNCLPPPAHEPDLTRRVREAMADAEEPH